MNPNFPQPSPPKQQKPAEKIPPLIHFACGWPLVMVAIGGAIGGALGGLAYGINMAIYKSKLPTPLKFVLNPLVGAAAVGIWWMIVLAIHSGRGR
jgi:hypothetical protein